MKSKNSLFVNSDGEKFSGWLVVFGCFALAFLGIGLVTGTASLFMEPITSQYGIDTGKYSLIFLVASITSAIGVMWFGPKLQKDNMVKTLILSVVATGICYFLMGLCNKLWQFIAVWGALNFIFAGASQTGIATIITKWFDHKKSIALSLSYSGIGMGTAVWSLVWGKLISNGNWQMCYFLGGLIVALGTSSLMFLFIKRDPQSVGQKPLTSKEKGEKEVSTSEVGWEGIEKKEAVKTLPFYMVVVAVVCVGWLAAGVATHAVNYLIGIGWSTRAASQVHSLYGIINIVALIVGGIIFDKLGLKKGTMVSLIFAIIGLVSLILSGTRVFGYIYAISYGLSLSLPRLMPAMLVSEIFGQKDYSVIYSLVNVIFLLGCAIGSVLTGVINDLIGYKVVWTLLAILCVVAFVAISIGLKSAKKLRTE